MKAKVKSYCERGLHLISLGKYQTTFYSEKTSSTYSSSVIGGLLTILLLLTIGGVIIHLLV